MGRPDFEAAQLAATKLLLDQDFQGLKFDVRDFHYDRKIIFDSVQNYCRIVKRDKSDFFCDGIEGSCTVSLPTKIHLILYDDDIECEERKHWGLAHEIGHIYRDHQEDSNDNEVEAHYFAGQMLSPEIALIYIAQKSGTVSADDVHDMFNISYAASKKRIQTLNNRCCYSYSAYDRELLERLKPWLDEYIERKTEWKKGLQKWLSSLKIRHSPIDIHPTSPNN